MMDYINHILEGDCLEILENIPDSSIDMVNCDLPYGTTQNKWDSVIPLDALWKQYKRVVKPSGVIVLSAHQVFTAKLILSNIKDFKYKIVWVKSKSTNFLNSKKQPLRKHEDILIFYENNCTYNPQMREGKPRQVGFNKKQMTGSYGEYTPILRNNEGQYYPTDVIYFETPEHETDGYYSSTQKPLELCKYLIETYSNPGDIILDNCFGSGTTLVAAIETERNFVGIEKNRIQEQFKNTKRDMFEIVKNRIFKRYECNLRLSNSKFILKEGLIKEILSC
jgi:site-specific DNA-methyltransferase (adenine-specific)/modification methylase